MFYSYERTALCDDGIFKCGLWSCGFLHHLVHCICSDILKECAVLRVTEFDSGGCWNAW